MYCKKEKEISLERYSETDTIGCGVNVLNNEFFFTKNGAFFSKTVFLALKKILTVWKSSADCTLQSARKAQSPNLN